MPGGIIVLVLSTIYSLFLLIKVTSIYGQRFIIISGDSLWNAKGIQISDTTYIIMWIVAILGYIFGAWIIISDVQNKIKFKKLEDDLDESKICPRCAEVIKFEAKVCKHCGFEFSDDEIERVKAERNKILEQDEFAFKKLPEYRLLQIAYDFQHNQDNFFKAKYYLERLLREYPKGEYNELAKKRLAEIKEASPQLFIRREEIKAVRPSSSGQPNQGTMPTFGEGTSPTPSKPYEPASGAPSRRICPRCHEALSAMARFCPSCGSEEEQPQSSESSPTCPQCGLAVNPGARFCGGCGGKLG